jgi:hypothetical protein
MYGLIGKMTAVSGQRDTLANAMLEGTSAMPGCLSTDAGSLRDKKESHAASPTLPRRHDGDRQGAAAHRWVQQPSRNNANWRLRFAAIRDGLRGVSPPWRRQPALAASGDGMTISPCPAL